MGCAASNPQQREELMRTLPPLSQGVEMRPGERVLWEKYKEYYLDVEAEYRREWTNDKLRTVPPNGDPSAPVPTRLVDIYRYVGTHWVEKLAGKIYDGIFGDMDPNFKWFADSFRRRDKALAVKHLVWFGLQRLGGPTTEENGGEAYSNEKMVQFHRSFVMNKRGRERWLMHANNALHDPEVVGNIKNGPQIVRILMKWFGDFCDICIEMNIIDG